MSAARRSLGGDLRRLAVAQTVADDAVLILSELVSNALKHARPLAGGKIRVAWWMEDDRILRIAVTDGGRQPRPPAPGTTATTTAHRAQDGGLEAADLDEVDESAVDGRGLGIVGVLADAWGVEPFAADPGQPPRPDDPAAPKTVWASVRLHARHASPSDQHRNRPGRPRRIAGVRAALFALPRGAGHRIGRVFGKGVTKGIGTSGEAKGSVAAVAG